MRKKHSLNLRISCFFLALIAITAIGVGTLVYKVNYKISIASSEKHLNRCGKYVDQIVDADMIDNWLANGEDDTYRLTRKDLEGVTKEFELSYLFVYRPVSDENNKIKNEVIYLFDINHEKISSGRMYDLGEHGYDLREYEEFKKVFETGEIQTTTVLSTESGEAMLTSLVPLRLENGEIYGIVGVCRQMGNIYGVATTSSVFLILAFETVIVVFGVLILIYIHRKVIKPVNILSKHMNSFVSGGSEFRFEPVTEIKTRDEIETMAEDFNTMADSILRYTGDLRRITADKERLRTELDVAGNIRSAVSADMSVPAFSDRSDFELYSSLKNTVYNSCSFCNYFMTDEDHLLIVMGESVGKTLPSMLMSMLASTSICAFARVGEEPYKIAYETNNSLCGFERNDIGMTVSALIVSIDLARGEMKYVNAGMPPLIIKRTGEGYAAEEEVIQFNLGEMHGVSFAQKTVRLNQGNVILLTSYGVQEMKDPGGEKFTFARLLNDINDISGKDYALQDMIGGLEGRLDSFRRGTQSELDTTILGFRYLG